MELDIFYINCLHNYPCRDWFVVDHVSLKLQYDAPPDGGVSPLERGNAPLRRIKEYYLLTKPGIIRGNLITSIGGFFLASRGTVDWLVLLGLIIGIVCIVASGCVFNNIYDRKIDSLMTRTKDRALVGGRIIVFSALIFGSTLFIIGVVAMSFTTLLAVFVSILGLFFYVLVYGYFKRKSTYGTLIGSISGATPPVIGYSAVTNSFDPAAILLFLILVSWQMPHFYAIGIYRKEEYINAGIPLLTIKEPFAKVRKHIIFYMFLFMVFVSALTLLGYTGFYFLLSMLVACWFWISASLESKEQNFWAKKIFGMSLVVLLIFSVLISVDFIFPF